MNRFFYTSVLAVNAALFVFSNSAFAGKICPIKPADVHSILEAEALAVKAADIYRLSPIPLKCATYKSGDDGAKSGASGPYWVSFYENHTEECGGIPNVAPRLFTITITSKGRMKTDAYGEDMASGKYRALRCPK